MIGFIKNMIVRVLFETCPNCESAWTGGVANPESIKFCVLCTNKNGKLTGHVWRWKWMSCVFGNIGKNLKAYRHAEDFVSGNRPAEECDSRTIVAAEHILSFSK